jgi:hypothetical protein
MYSKSLGRLPFYYKSLLLFEYVEDYRKSGNTSLTYSNNGPQVRVKVQVHVPGTSGVLAVSLLVEKKYNDRYTYLYKQRNHGGKYP